MQDDEVKSKQAVQVWMPTPQIGAIDSWRRSQPDLPSRAEALRRLADQVLSKNITESTSA
jgi:hypothetical protein